MGGKHRTEVTEVTEGDYIGRRIFWREHRKRSTNYTVERGAGFGRLVPGGPSGGRKFSDSIDRKIG